MTPDRPLARELRWPAAGVLAAFLIAGAFTRAPRELGLSLTGCVVAIAAAILLPARGARAALALGALAGAGVVLDAGSRGQSVAWFGLCVLAGCMMVDAGPKLGVVFLLAAEAVLIGHLLIPHVNLGWSPWVAGVAVSAGATALVVRQQQLVTQLRAAQAGLAERSRAEERNRIARDLHDVIAHSLTVSLLHIASARLTVSEEPEDAQRALAEAERSDARAWRRSAASSA